MSSPPHEIPALPVVVPLAAAAFTILLWQLKRRSSWSIPRIVVAAATCVYGAGIVANTIFPVYIGTGGNDQPWRVFINLTPFADTEAADMLANVAVFVPLGILLPLMARIRSRRGVVLFAFLLSLAMEMVQLINAVTGHGGHIADVNDLLANTLGGALGHEILRALLFVPAVSRVVPGSDWPVERSGPADQEAGLPPRS